MMHLLRKPYTALSGWLWLSVFLLMAGSGRGTAAEVAAAQKLFLKGDYSACIRVATNAINDQTWDEDWWLLLAKAQLATGHYPEAQKTIDTALGRRQSSVQLRLLGYEVYQANGQIDRATAMLQELNQLASSRMASYLNDAPSLVAVGRAALLMNIDPKIVLENFFDQARKADPNYREAWLASGDLALQKHDYALASKTYTAALTKFPGDPDAEFGLAQAFEPSDASQMAKWIEAVLDFNTNHTGAMLLLADRMIDAEAYPDAQEMLSRILKVNPWNPDAWAYRAVLAHLNNDTNAEASARASALKYWPANPRVDNLIGTKISQKYRFAEGAEYQKQALKFDTNYLPARIQLAQDFLRLGNETQGWDLATDVHDSDGYDVTAYNLVTLKDTMAKFKTVTNKDFIVRMDAREATIYGDRVLDLLQRAKDHLSEKYGYHLDQPTVVEIFNEQKDFGVRTFGVPHNPGYLGVCFGHVVTANSPAAQAGHPANWEAVLWHEFCHVITLGITRNKMPRWLSEGISVYEERQANPTWGQGMTPRYREMILGKDFVPVGELSGAFMSPKSPLHMQFAYYESNLVVEYIIQTYGLQALKDILADLGKGVEINDALARHTAAMDKIEKDFQAFAVDRANKLAPGLDWTKPEELTTEESSDSGSVTNYTDVIKRVMRKKPAPSGSSGTNSVPTPRPMLAASNVTNSADSTASPAVKAASSTNYYDLMDQAEAALNAKKFAEAKAPLLKLIELYPTQMGPDSAYEMLAAAHRGLDETNAEREVLIKLAALEDDGADDYLRLMALDEDVKDWQGEATNAERFLAVNPLVPEPYRRLARASEEKGDAPAAIRSYQRMLLLDPTDPADVHFHLARLYRQQGELVPAKRHVLQSLEDAPRFRDAQALLLDIENAPAKR
jgi:Tfp pilus assembly protein PilF